MKSHSPLLSSAASISSLQSFDTIRQGPSTSATSVACSDDHRWSEVVPPDSGLTFAVVWDPEENDILTFSSAELSDPVRDRQSPDSPSDAYSQVLTIGPSLAPPSECTGTLQCFRENHDSLFAESAFFPDRPTRGRTQTSSTLDGLDVYLRGSLLGRAHNANRYVSCFQELDDDFSFDPRTSFAHMWLKQMKDSTSNFVTVENEMDDEATTAWSAVEAPNTPSYSRLLFTGLPHSQRRLRKTRPVTRPASPAAVLDRPEYSHNLPVPVPGTPKSPRARSRPPSTPSTPLRHHLSMPKFARGLGKWRKSETTGWVWIDVKGEPQAS
ncbi:hypothetical protein FB451DRAFT_1265806 [Mycena latifolia]|nr:hypothetical protein FB451DRAFT_1265806 [Mycena latifolia]